ncbi:MAG: hypothetical protein LUD27_04770, partial [Clostridia bacterium]|nr:hypothetical protein [Clostridia bacterium]
MQNLSYVLDVLLVLDCGAAVAFSFLLVRNTKRWLDKTPPYEKAVESGLPDYKLGGRLYESLYGRYSHKRDTVTPEVEYEAYRQDVFCKNLLRLLAVSFAFAVIADLCCFFDGLEAESYTLGLY